MKKKSFSLRLCLPHKLLLFGLCLVLLLGATVRPARAATFDVNTTVDTVDSNPGNGICADSGGNCSLRAAIMEANAFSGADTINLPAGSYTLSIAGTGEDAAATGDLDISGDLTIVGAGAATTTINGNNLDRVFESRPAAGVTVTINISGVTITGGNVTGIGFVGAAFGDRGATTGITNLTMNDVVINTNTCGNNGGGIGLVRNLSATSNPSLTLNRSTISGNSAVNGGGIYCSGCTMNINHSAITGNTVTTIGGGINVAGNTANVTLAHSTVSGNTANSNGGGVGKSLGTGTVLVNFSTITNNIADNDNNASGDGGGIYSNSGTTLQNSIVQGNTDRSTAAANDCSGTVASSGYNVVGAGTGCPSGGANDSTGAALLGALQDNGGPTFTHLPATGSVAIERVTAGSSGCNPGVSVDQRGAVRADGANRGDFHCDSGAVEGDSDQKPTAIGLKSLSASVPGDSAILALAGIGLLAAAVLAWRSRRK